MALKRENMADDMNISRAFNLLREATQLLSGSAEAAGESRTQSSLTQGNEESRNGNIESSYPNTPNTAGPSESGSAIPPLSSTPMNAVNNQNVLRSFQSLFSPYSRPLGLGRGRGTGSRPARSRQRQPHAASSRNTREETWTHEVFCLASTNQQVAPRRELKEELQRAGLGREKIRFNASGNPQSFKETLEKTFPKLMYGGGFELLRRGMSGSQLILIQPPPIGYSVQFLKTSSGIGQAVLYVRPIQSDLDTSPETMKEESSYSEDAESAPKVACLNCGVCVPITLVRTHQEDCVGSGRRLTEATVEGMEATTSAENRPNLNDQGDDIRMSMMLPSLREMFPDQSEQCYRSALCTSNFDLQEAAEILLGQGSEDTQNVNLLESGDSDIEELLDMPLSGALHIPDAEPNVHVGENDEVSCGIDKSIAFYKEATIDTSVPRQLFSVCRIDGIEDMKADILSTYKNPSTSLVARPRVRFEDEEGLGAGPLREFLHLAVKVAQDGIGSSTKPVIYFEGDVDHKLPIHNPALRQTGSFRAIGRILGHSFLHGGPSLCGLSHAVKHYFSCKNKQDVSLNPPPLEITDVPDVDLQNLLKEMLDFPTDQALPGETWSTLLPYLNEAGVDVELLSSNREMVVQCILLYNVIEKRKLELDDILVGMETVGLKSFVEKHPASIPFLFPTQREAIIHGEEVKARIQFQDESVEINRPVKDMFLEYIDLIENRKEDYFREILDGADLRDLCCFWTGWNILPPRSEKLNVMFDKSGANELPMAECCFNNIIIPVVHSTFEKFTKMMDIALKHGSQGFTFS